MHSLIQRQWREPYPREGRLHRYLLVEEHADEQGVGRRILDKLQSGHETSLGLRERVVDFSALGDPMNVSARMQQTRRAR